ncbi:hypothetical protein H2202_000501 [Exophiala xenobiotica]|nr:hypothetical protein H2202_000501 [Exophiala xenobiotica]KAK5246873.1 hypothetical protein LTS06_007879 [Exophiala xenobiotica]KAK5356784.1 hypothetical protein LTR61_000519 [Exophiala xenobiotica]KAK5376936.1 hypothetical protein LTR11_004600 [Exophiala xenobiotica]KAK5382265.1 hypothetical protein LTS13_002929 [Exophiala xenobiotica]
MVSAIKKMAKAAVLFLAASTNAHMIMKSPVPYGKSTLNNSPLNGDGSDFPCKQRSGVYDAEGASNVAAIGDPQTLSFIGQATHGGGSCQVSLTTDLQPTINSKWSVILSIEGGCPTSQPGNIGGDPNGGGSSTFQYTVPEGIAPGEYTLAWSWINKVGNREFYMNCAPLTVTAAKKKRYAPTPKMSKRQTSFPDMFVANLASVNDCVTPESFDYVYPNPGSVVQSAGTGPYTTLSCGAATGNNAAQTPTATGAASAAATGSATESSPAIATSAAGGSSSPAIFATGAASAASPASTDAASVIPIDATSTAAPAATPSTSTSSGNGSDSGSASTNTSAAGTQSGPCTNEGLWSAVISMESGMACTPGVSMTFSQAATAGKSKRHLHSHLRRHAELHGESLH